MLDLVILFLVRFRDHFDGKEVAGVQGLGLVHGAEGPLTYFLDHLIATSKVALRDDGWLDICLDVLMIDVAHCCFIF